MYMMYGMYVQYVMYVPGYVCMYVCTALRMYVCCVYYCSATVAVVALIVDTYIIYL